MSTHLPPDYSKENCWLFKEDNNTAFDVFYVYPTFFNGAAGAVMDIYNTRLKPILISNVKKNTGIFQNASIYAPLYRQASFKTLFLSDEETNKALATPYQDILDAFDYFDKNISKGRPFILAGHSQGARMIANLLKCRFSSSALQKRLIAAYLQGYCLTYKEVEEFSHIKPAQQAADTGVVITYNTQSPDVTQTPIFTGKAVCINPLNWTTSKEVAARQLHEGAVFFDRYANPVRTIQNFTSAYIDDNGFLITPDAEEETYSSGIFQKGIFHIYDYDFFYINLRRNATLRIQKYFSSSDVAL